MMGTDEIRFDRLTRWLRRAIDRRAAVVHMSGARGVGLGLVALEDAASKQPKKRCGSGRKRCGKRCVRGDCCPGKPCGGSEICTCSRSVHGTRVCTEKTGGVCVQCETTALTCAAGERCVQVTNRGDVTAICKPLCLP